MNVQDAEKRLLYYEKVISALGSPTSFSNEKLQCRWSKALNGVEFYVSQSLTDEEKVLVNRVIEEQGKILGIKSAVIYMK
ncbi:MAG: hypothetical protein V4675_01230 [Verrucomicrobiota bacterium]